MAKVPQDKSPVMSLSVELAPSAEEGVRKALTWLTSFSPEAAERLEVRLQEELERLAQSIAEEIETQGKPSARLDDGASTHFSRPIYRYAFQTGKIRQRRSSTGLWYIYYALIASRSEATQPDQLRMFAFQHSAAAPLGVSTGRIEEESEASF